MQTNITRDDIIIDIEECKENIYEQRHAMWFFRLGAIILILAFTTAFISFAVVDPLQIPYLVAVANGSGTVATIITILLGLGLGAWLIVDYTLRVTIGHWWEAKRLLKKLQRHLAFYDAQVVRHLSPEEYLHQLPGLIASYRKQADAYRRWFVVLQLITIFLSAAITSLSGGWLDKYLSIPWIIPVLGVLISILTSFTLFFKLREKGTNLQQTADTMDWEHMACTLEIGKYKGMAEKDRLVLLAETAENLRQEQQKRQLQLEQSSHTEQKALQVP